MINLKLKDIAVSQTGPFGSQLHEHDYVDFGTPIVTVEHLGETGFSHQNLPLVSDTDKVRLSKYLLKEGDIVFSRVGSVDRNTYVSKSEDGWLFSGRCIRVRVDKAKADPKFISFYFRQRAFKEMMLNISVGATMPSLNTSLMDNIPLRLPELNTQQKIAKVLSDLDAKIELNNSINAELEAMAKLIYEYWFVQFDFPNQEGKPYKSSGGKMVWNEELKREVPEGWGSGYLSDLGKIVGGSTPSRENPEFFTKDGIPWITPKDLSNNIGNKFIFRGELDVTKKGKENASLTLMPIGTILMSSRAPIGYLAISVSEVTTNQGFKSFVPQKPFTTEFIYYKINEMMPVIENNASGSTFKEVSSSTLKGIKIVIPSYKIIEGFTQRVSSIFEKQGNLQKQNQELSAMRDWLLPMLMNGQVRVMEANEESGKKYQIRDLNIGMVAEYTGN